MGFRDYYRQFEEMAPDEISEELLALRDERRRRALSRVDPLDLDSVSPFLGPLLDQQRRSWSDAPIHFHMAHRRNLDGLWEPALAPRGR